MSKFSKHYYQNSEKISHKQFFTASLFLSLISIFFFGKYMVDNNFNSSLERASCIRFNKTTETVYYQSCLTGNSYFCKEDREDLKVLPINNSKLEVIIPDYFKKSTCNSFTLLKNITQNETFSCYYILKDNVKYKVYLGKRYALFYFGFGVIFAVISLISLAASFKIYNDIKMQFHM